MRIAVGLIAFVLGCSGGSSPTSADLARAEPDAGPSTAPGQISWIVSVAAVQAIAQQGAEASALAQAYFDDARTFVVVDANDVATGRQLLPHATLTQGFTDFTSGLAPALQNGTLLSGVAAVYYDAEHWSFTPMNEQQDPSVYYAMAAQLAHANGYSFLAVPATDLVKSLEPNYAGSIYPEFVQLGIPGDAAKFADVYEMQSQGSEMALDVFTPFVEDAAAQAHAANSSVHVLAGLSTNPSSGDPTAQQLLDAVLATRGTVEGYWLNVPAPGPYCPSCNPQRPDLAAALLALLASHG